VTALYELSVWLHILAATAWLGGMFFLVLVVVPWLRTRDGAMAGAFLRETGTRFRTVAWACFAVLLVTGALNLLARGVRPGDLVSPAWHASPFGRAVMLKLTLFAATLVVSALHDFRLGPRAADALDRDPTSAEATRLRRLASLLGYIDAVLALALVATAVIIVRGWPF